MKTYGFTEFLGWKHPGPIEAVLTVSVNLAVSKFLGWKHPGPIEAALLPH